MASYSKVILMGNLTRDPEVKFTPQGTAVANFGVAVNRKYKQGDELKEEVGFFDIVVFGKQAENCGSFLAKGRSVLVEGRLQQRRWETDGQKRSKVEVVAQIVQFLGGNSNGNGHPTAPAEIDDHVNLDTEDVPF